MTTTPPLQLWRVETLRPINTKDAKTIITHISWKSSDESAKEYADEVVRKGGQLVAITKYVAPDRVFPVFDRLDFLLSNGHTITKEKEYWRLRNKHGKLILTGTTYRDLCINIALAGL